MRNSIFIIVISWMNMAFPQATLPDSNIYSDLHASTTQQSSSQDLSKTVEEIPPPEELNFINSPHLLGYWDGFRNQWEMIGFTFDVVDKFDYYTSVYNTPGDKKAALLNNADLIFGFDLGSLLGIKGTSLTAHILGNDGNCSTTELCGASQTVSNIETVPTWKVYQFLIESELFSEGFSVLAGLYDYNSEFDCRTSSALFINSSHGVGDEIAKSGKNGPSIFPTTSMTLRLKYHAPSNYYIQAAVLDGVPGNPENPIGTHIIFNRSDGFFIASEIGFDETDVEIGKYSFGLWYYTGFFEDLTSLDNPREIKGNYGFYFSGEKTLYTEKNSERSFDSFFRIGFADEKTNPVSSYIGVGIRMTGLLPGQIHDEIGIAGAYTRYNKYFRTQYSNEAGREIAGGECNLELTYLFKPTSWLTLQPDVQWIINPIDNAVGNSAVMTGIRTIISF